MVPQPLIVLFALLKVVFIFIGFSFCLFIFCIVAKHSHIQYFQNVQICGVEIKIIGCEYVEDKNSDLSGQNYLSGNNLIKHSPSRYPWLTQATQVDTSIIIRCKWLQCLVP